MIFIIQLVFMLFIVSIASSLICLAVSKFLKFRENLKLEEKLIRDEILPQLQFWLDLSTAEWDKRYQAYMRNDQAEYDKIGKSLDVIARRIERELIRLYALKYIDGVKALDSILDELNEYAYHSNLKNAKTENTES